MPRPIRLLPATATTADRCDHLLDRDARVLEVAGVLRTAPDPVLHAAREIDCLEREVASLRRQLALPVGTRA